MDTNSLALLVELVARQKSVVGPLGPNSVLIATIVAAALAPCLISFAGWIKAKSIEQAVNGDRASMLADLEKKELRITELEVSKAVTAERERLRDLSDIRKVELDMKAVAKAEGKMEGVKEESEKPK